MPNVFLKLSFFLHGFTILSQDKLIHNMIPQRLQCVTVCLKQFCICGLRFSCYWLLFIVTLTHRFESLLNELMLLRVFSLNWRDCLHIVAEAAAWGIFLFLNAFKPQLGAFHPNFRCHSSYSHTCTLPPLSQTLISDIGDVWHLLPLPTVSQY